MTYFNDVTSLKAVELKKLCRSHGIDETYPKKAKQISLWFCWPCAQYDEEYMFQESGADWNCPSCTRDCDIIY